MKQLVADARELQAELKSAEAKPDAKPVLTTRSEKLSYAMLKNPSPDFTLSFQVK
jgi:hypothetical protein